jgi:hypothetical protein
MWIGISLAGFVGVLALVSLLANGGGPDDDIPYDV